MERTPEVITKLVADLQSDDEFVRSQAAFALGIMGEPAVPALLPLLRAPDRDMRLRAAWTLGVIGGPAIPALLELLEQPFRQLRIEAIRILGVIGEARSINLAGQNRRSAGVSSLGGGAAAPRGRCALRGRAGAGAAASA